MNTFNIFGIAIVGVLVLKVLGRPFNIWEFAMYCTLCNLCNTILFDEA